MRQARTAAVRRTRARPVGRPSDVSLFKTGKGGYRTPVRARHSAAIAALAIIVVLLWAPIAGAANPPPGPIGNPNDPRDHGRDPCTVKNKVPPWCQQAPEAPVALLYPAVAAAALTLFLVVERRRRTRSGA